ncbi:thiazole synthase [Evansella caseinilytica]|uniref:Thiazole synthase n=1 Tax=Evansella caseinilytica TaxID=1503961 RepID=A0A1H3GSS3_9BACI|nr:thiazole synthase [Evansella caseinilytica]SDY06376.1 thiazole synthase [Evansella caseinilytica]
MSDVLTIGGKELTNRLFIGTGKFADHKQMGKAIESSKSQVVTVALRRVNMEANEEDILADIPGHVTLMPNTSGARTADEAVRIARLAKACGMGNWIKIEVISDHKYLLPDNEETTKATEILAKEGFVVLPYMSPDLMAAKRMYDAGAAAIMPLGAPIGSNKGIRMREMIQILIDEIDLPIVVDAGIGKPSEAAEAMEMGADAVLVNTAIATASDPVEMAKAFDLAVKAGRAGYLSGLGPVSAAAHASSPLTGFLG